jgi:type 1 glutamine amidotransferase
MNMEKFIQGGGGYVGIHAAADTEYEWDWYGKLVGAYFKSHPAIQEATVMVLDRKHISTKHLPSDWVRRDEWYDYRARPADDVHILCKLMTTSYTGHTMGLNHPIAWCHEYDGGRAFYTGGGHTKETFSEPDFMKHVLGGILWAAKRAD